jgi:hypothetical protein
MSLNQAASQAFLNAKDIGDLEAAVREHPVLLEPSSLEELHRAINTAQGTFGEHLTQHLRTMLNELSRMANPTAPSFPNETIQNQQLQQVADFKRILEQFLAAKTPEAMRELTRNEPFVLSDKFVQAITNTLAQANKVGSQQQPQSPPAYQESLNLLLQIQSETQP